MVKERQRTKRKGGKGSSRVPERGETRRRRRPIWLRLLGWLVFLGVIAGLLGGLGLAGLFYYYGSDPTLPRIGSVHDYRPKTTTRIFDRKHRLIGEISAERRTVVPYRKIPKLLVKAVVSAEDAEFFKHRGLDYLGMLRAFFANLRAGHFVQGGSTITQQVIKTLFLSPKRTIRRKMQEVILARQLENQLRKDEILYLYLNQIYFGHGRYGVQEASRFYFGKDVDKIGLAECALLAGLPQSPQRLSPVKHPKRAKRRQTYVLGQMAKHGFISKAVAKRVAAEPIRIVRHTRDFYGAAPEFTDRIRAKLAEAYGEKKLASLGIDVRASVDVKFQIAAREALRSGLQAIDRRQGYRRRIRHLKGRSLKRMFARLARKQKKMRPRRSYRAIVSAIDDAKETLVVDLGSRRATVSVSDERYNPQGHVPSRRFKVGDLLRLRAEAGSKGSLAFVFDPGPQGALVSIDPRTGDVVALVSGYRYHPGDFNRALQAARQPGSAFKPFVYGAALDGGRYTPATIVDDAPVIYGKWSPKNFEKTYRGPLRLRVALAHSVNTVAARLIHEVGLEAVRRLAERVGISSALGKDLSLALGTSNVLPIDLATAYATIANGGKRVTPTFILKAGAEVMKRPVAAQVLRPAVAYVLTSMMQSVVREGTARRARQLGRPVAGKTGTTNGYKDAWFAGFTPQLVTVVWVGFDRPRKIGRLETGGRAALPIWIRFMRRALRGKPKLPFRQPPGVVVQRIDPKTGLLASAGATDAIEEVFVAGTDPKEVAPSADQVDPATILMGGGVP
ncbi:MAG: PBP1A family penicillin-binding protein [Deltaproteobacteria bacterium]|nr:PBP1A family penicillin-binding protein [Deltaproteobacteria bacterium]